MAFVFFSFFRLKFVFFIISFTICFINLLFALSNYCVICLPPVAFRRYKYDPGCPHSALRPRERKKEQRRREKREERREKRRKKRKRSSAVEVRILLRSNYCYS